VFKQRLFVSDVGAHEINETGGGSDECKFAIWSRRSSSLPDGKIILKVLTMFSFHIVSSEERIAICRVMDQKQTRLFFVLLYLMT